MLVGFEPQQQSDDRMESGYSVIIAAFVLDESVYVMSMSC